MNSLNEQVPIANLKEKRKHDDEFLSNSLNTEDSRPSEDDFIKSFTGWLEKTSAKVDESTLARMKGDLCQIVGKYELEFTQKKK